MIPRPHRRSSLAGALAAAAGALTLATPIVASTPPGDSPFPEFDVTINPRVMVSEQAFPAAALELTLLFLGATERGDFETAARMLTSSAADDSQRYDFEILPDFPDFSDGVAAALDEWCLTVDVCRRPTALATTVDEPFVATVTATFGDIDDGAGGALQHDFAVVWHEGYAELRLFPFEPPS